MPPSIKITKEEINALPLVAYEGPITIIDDDVKLDQVIPLIRKEKVLGFDTESRPSFKKGQNFPVSLIQLGGSDHVWLFQVKKLNNPDSLWRILGDSSIKKVGVAISDDIKKLQELKDFQPAGFKEVADLTQKAGILNTGLRSLAGLLLNIRISKRAQVSNWARSNLTEAQIQYAGTDAWVSRNLYLHMLDLRKRAKAQPGRASA
ncbi:MAG: 3'-5' exonuclease [Opitutales bacterium]|jgi:ribonuclease D